MKPLTTEPPLSPPDTKEDVIEWKRYKMYKQGLLDEERLHDSLNAEHELELEHQAMQELEPILNLRDDPEVDPRDEYNGEKYL